MRLQFIPSLHFFFAIICKQAKNGSAMKEKLKDEEPAYSPPSSPKPSENLEETESVLLGMVLVMHGEGMEGGWVITIKRQA